MFDSPPFDTVLVANRGEIAVRIMRTLHEHGITAIGVHSAADIDAWHVASADASVLLGPAEARLSYLDIEKVVQAAVSTGAEALHPGYGFLSENADLAQACEDAGVVFIGPTPQTIRLMGDKRRAKQSVAALGVPVVPGFDGAGADDARLAQACIDLGFPIIVKPSAGGGGKGMRVVRNSSEVTAALASARREAAAAFGDDTLLLERYVPRARHIEVQVAGDGRGDAIHLGTRDCSLQRRHQKVVEEAPAPALADDVRERMHADALAIARSVSYRGVGTVEFVLDADDPQRYYFLEMNTRLQVEHPVTEAVTGVDLVALQLRVAAGLGLGLQQQDVRLHGHAVEVRVYAEDGHHGFLPSSGRLLACRVPATVRLDSGVRPGDTVGTSYDPLLFKMIASGPDRATALDRLDGALSQTAVLGLAHNIGALRELLAAPEVRTADMTTGLIAEMGLGSTVPDADPHRLAAAALLLANARENASTSPWVTLPGWRVGDPAASHTPFVDDAGRETTVQVSGASTDCLLAIDDGAAQPAHLSLRGDQAVVSLSGLTRTYTVAVDDSSAELRVWLSRDGDAFSYRVPVRHRIVRPDDDAVSGGEVRSPMPGAVVVLARAAGDAVTEGDVIAVIEAMKMEYPLLAPITGTVSEVLVSAGAQVARDQLVATVAATEPEG